MNKITVIVFSLFLIQACQTRPDVDANYQLSSSKDGIFIIGGADDNAQYNFSKNTSRKGDFKGSGALAYMGSPKEGFIIGRVPPNLEIGLLEHHSKDNLRGAHLCGGGRTFTFKVPESGVVYIGHIDKFDKEVSSRHAMYGHIKELTLKKDFKAAKEYIEKNFPNLKESLTEGEFKYVPTVPCVIETYVPIILG